MAHVNVDLPFSVVEPCPECFAPRNWLDSGCPSWGLMLKLDVTCCPGLMRDPRNFLDTQWLKSSVRVKIDVLGSSQSPTSGGNGSRNKSWLLKAFPIFFLLFRKNAISMKSRKGSKAIKLVYMYNYVYIYILSG